MSRLFDYTKTVMGCTPAALTSTAGDGRYVSFKNARKMRMTLSILNGTTVTGGTVTLKQATAVAGTNEKPLPFGKMFINTDCAASDVLLETAVTSDTFTTNATNGKLLLYQIELRVSDLDINNGFGCVRVDVTGMTNAVGSIIYDLYDFHAVPPTISAITD
ncbi:MAG TPA: hypothetical protein VHB01_13470 [Nitrosospira sp.]|nr:hypothetical protein [Nitrosospira sp.]